MTLRSQPRPCRSSYPLRLSRKNIFARMQVLIQPRPHSIWTQPKDPFHAHTPTFRVTDDAQVSSRSSGADSVAVRAHASAPTTNDAPGTVSNADATLRSADWHAPMDSSVICLKVADASKSRQQLDPKTIPNALKQMAFYRVFIPLQCSPWTP